MFNSHLKTMGDSSLPWRLISFSALTIFVIIVHAKTTEGSCDRGEFTGKSWEFHGTTESYIVAPGSFPDMSDFSVCFWVKTSDQLQQQFAFFTYSVPGYPNEIALAVVSNDVLYLMMNHSPDDFGSRLSIYDFVGKYNITDGQWHHLCMVLTQSAHFFLDGHQENFVLEALDTPFSGGGILVIGQLLNSHSSTDFKSSFSFAGRMSDFNIWSYTISQTEVTMLNNQGQTSLCGNVLAYANFVTGDLFNVYVEAEPSFAPPSTALTTAVTSASSSTESQSTVSQHAPATLTDAFTCGGSYEGMEGAIASPGYPATYPNDVDCVYQIQVPEGYIVQLTFEDIEVEYSSDCAYDYIAVYDGPDSSSELMGTYCGVANKIDKLPSGILRSSSRSMCVKFTSDAGIQYRGFKAAFLAGAVMAYTDGRSTFAHQVFENSTSIDTAITDNTGFDISGETDVTPIIAGSVVGILFLSVVTLSVWYMKKVYQKKRIAVALESEKAQEGEGAEGALPEEEETEDTYLFMKESAEGIQIPTDLLTAKESAEGIEIGAEGHVQKAPLPQAQPLTVPAAIPQPIPLQRRGLPPLGRPTQVAPEMSVEGVLPPLQQAPLPQIQPAAQQGMVSPGFPAQQQALIGQQLLLQGLQQGVQDEASAQTAAALGMMPSPYGMQDQNQLLLQMQLQAMNQLRRQSLASPGLPLQQQPLPQVSQAMGQSQGIAPLMAMQPTTPVSPVGMAGLPLQPQLPLPQIQPQLTQSQLTQEAVQQAGNPQTPQQHATPDQSLQQQTESQVQGQSPQQQQQTQETNSSEPSTITDTPAVRTRGRRKTKQ